MRRDEFDTDLSETAQYVREISSHLPIDPASKIRLREELMRRHQELTVGTTQRAAGKLWPRFSGLKRLTLVAPPALAVVLVLGMVLGGLDVNGHRGTQAVEAARLTRAMARVMPTLTSWNVALHRDGADDSSSVGWKASLEGKHLLVRGRRTYLHSGNQWFAITVDQTQARRLFDWQWGFAMLPNRLARNQFGLLPARLVDGQRAEGVRYTLVHTPAETVEATAWINANTGLVVRLERNVIAENRVVEHDWADYRYQRSS